MNRSKECLSYKSRLEEYVLALYQRMKACSGRIMTCGGLHWRYLTEDEKEHFSSP